MPLSAINDLFRLAKTSLVPTSPLLPGLRGKMSNMVWVNKDFFQGAPNGNHPEDVSEDVLAFFSLVLSYVKPNGYGRDINTSPKNLSPIMPRTDFLTMYNVVRSKFQGDLYGLVRVLLCYRNGQDDGEDLE